MRATDREILRLAVPAFFTLVAEPLFLLADTAVVGHLGTAELAGVGIAGVVLQTLVGVCVFLAYGTTASVARRLGGGDLRGALAQGIDGLWLAIIIGVIATAIGLLTVTPLIGLFDVGPTVAGHAEDYLTVALLGVTPLLVMLASTGVLRGLQDTRTPLWVALGGNLLNIVLNLTLVFGLGPFPALGVAGAAWGSVVAQLLSAAVLTAVVVRGARRHDAPLTPDLPGILAAGRSGIALVVRTVTLRAALVVSTYAVASGAGAEGTAVATHQIVFTLWTFLAFALDAIAIAGQALTGRALGAGDRAVARALTRRMVGWGIWSGVLAGLLLGLAGPFLGPVFSPDPLVQELLIPVLLVAALGQPVAGVVFVLDGVLIGAGDGRYLAWAGVVTLALYAPAVWLAVQLWAGGVGVSGAPADDGRAVLITVWAVFVVVFMGSRAVALARRAIGDTWMVTGVPASRRAAS